MKFKVVKNRKKSLLRKLRKALDNGDVLIYKGRPLNVFEMSHIESSLKRGTIPNHYKNIDGIDNGKPHISDRALTRKCLFTLPRSTTKKYHRGD